MMDFSEKDMELALEEFKQKLEVMSEEDPQRLAAFLAEFESKLDELQKIIDEPDA